MLNYDIYIYLLHQLSNGSLLLLLLFVVPVVVTDDVLLFDINDDVGDGVGVDMGGFTRPQGYGICNNTL